MLSHFLISPPHVFDLKTSPLSKKTEGFNAEVSLLKFIITQQLK